MADELEKEIEDDADPDELEQTLDGLDSIE